MESILLRDLYQKDHALASSLNGQEITVSCRSSMNMARCSLIRMDPLPMKGKKPSRP